MTPDTCQHMRGDTFEGMWICADCFTPLGERPKRYGGQIGKGIGAARYEVVWVAPIAIAANGISFSTFLGWIVWNLRVRSFFSISKETARRQCLDALRDMGEPFGSDDCEWSRSAAKDIVTEGVCAYWDSMVGGGSNK